MSKKRYQSEYEKRLAELIKQYLLQVDDLYFGSANEAAAFIDRAKTGVNEPFYFKDNPQLKKPLLSLKNAMYAGLFSIIANSQKSGWNIANDKQDSFVTSYLEKFAAQMPEYETFFDRNEQALRAFIKRKSNIERRGERQ
ncbi:MAG: hypothetical protein LBG77_02590 [Dysgonamonadaceae bacterium]|jgi:cob(I)alamin adenosyltransferase|nr:hypothetical protein [Dysgonamonadaceae bacterium]